MAWTVESRKKVGELGLGARLSDAEYAIFSCFLPEPKTGGRPSKTDRQLVLDAILYVLRTGCQWRMLPVDFPPWQTTYGFFRAWSQAGVWEKALAELRKQARRAAGRDPIGAKKRSRAGGPPVAVETGCAIVAGRGAADRFLVA